MNDSLKYYKSLLTSWQWRKLRHDKLSKTIFCERCVSQGKQVPNLAVDVHHVVPVMRAAPDRGRMRVLFFDPHNLQALCADCYKKVHDEMKMHVCKEKRKEIRMEQLEEFKKKFFKGA